MAYSSKDFLSWDDDIDLDNLLGEYTADENEKDTGSVKEKVIYVCPDCDKENKTISGFRGHSTKKHNKSLKVPGLNMEAEGFDSDDEGDTWEETETESVSVKCLFCDRVFEASEDVFSHCRSEHGFRIEEVCNKWKLDCFGYIKLVNFIRRTNPSPEILQFTTDTEKPPWDSDNFMQPFDPEDELLQFDIEEMTTDTGESGTLGDTVNGTAGMTVSEGTQDYQQLLQKLHRTEMRLQESDEKLRAVLEDMENMKLVTRDLILSQPMSTETTDHSDHTDKDTGSGDSDDPYFSSYGHYAIHEEMIKDRVRTESYRDFLYQNKDVVRDKVVLDLGCGTGILSLFAAQAGAKHVYAVDNAEIIYQAMDIARVNGMSDKITFIKGKLEDVGLPVEKVDIIISEWMGYFLLFESMLDSVLFARAKHLAPTGSVYPDRCNISITLLSDLDLYNKHVTFWDDVYGFKMGCMRTCVLREASVEVVDKEKIIANSAVLLDLDVGTCGLDDLQFSSDFKLTIHADGPVTAVIGYFDIFFEKDCSNIVKFSTGPHSAPTHWKQSVFLLDAPLEVHKGQILHGNLTCRKNRKDPRSLTITIKLEEKVIVYHME